ncbi:MAG: Ig-like domain-containing protein [Clostridia bacterium]|nr:Ig-like domain-containing protein [Clostridia bacterium]
MKKKIVSTAVCVSLLASFSVFNVKAEEDVFPEYLYDAEFETATTDVGEYGLSVKKNAKNDSIEVKDGKLVFARSVNDWTQIIALKVNNSEDWEEYEVRSSVELDANHGYFGYNPDFNSTSPDAVTYLPFRNSNGFGYSYDDKTLLTQAERLNSAEIGKFIYVPSWGWPMRFTMKVNSETSELWAYPEQTCSSLDIDGEKVLDKKNRENGNGLSIVVEFCAADSTIDYIRVKDLRAKAILKNNEEVAAGDKLLVKFSEDMDTSKFVSSNVAIEKNGTIIDGLTVETNSVREMLVTVPAGLGAGTEYNLIVKKEITDADGDRMNNDKVLSFTTKSGGINLISSSVENEANNIETDLKNITLTFDSNVDTSAAVVTLKDTDNNSIDASVDSVASKDNVAVININGLMNFATEYVLKVTDIKKADTDEKSGVEIKFITKAAPEENNILYENDFSNNMDGIQVVANDGSVTVEDGWLKTNVTGDASLFIEGSENWHDYTVDMTVSMKGIPSYMFLYPNHSATVGGNSEPGYLVVMNQNDRFNYENRVINSWTSAMNYNFRIVVSGDHTEFWATYAGGNLEKFDEKEITDAKGFLFRTMWNKGNVDIDSIKVTDNSTLKAYVYNAANVMPEDVVTIKFNETMSMGDIYQYPVYFENGGTKIMPAYTFNGTDEIYVTVPSGVLSNETYKLVVPSSIKSASGNSFNGDKVFEVTTAKLNFNIISSSPENGAVDIDVYDDISITFDGDIDYSKVSEFVIYVKDSENNEFPMTVNTVLSTAKTLFLSSDKAFEAGKEYTVEISNVYSTTGDKMLGKKVISFNTKEADEDYLYYNDFSDSSTISEFDVTTGTGSETVSIHDGALYAVSGTANLVDANAKAMATIKGSEAWSDYEIEIELEGKSNNRFVNIGLRNSLTLLMADYNATSNISLGDASATISSNESPDQSAMLGKDRPCKMVITAVGNNFKVRFNDVEYINTTINDANKRGAISLGGIFDGTIAYNSIKVKDLGVSYTVSKVKNLAGGEEFYVTFDQLMNTDTFDIDFVSVTDADGDELNIEVNVIDNYTMGITLPVGVNSNGIYTVKLSTDIMTAAGLSLPVEKTFTIKTLEAAFSVTELKLENASGELNSLNVGDTVKATAYVKNATACNENMVLVLAVYKNNKLSEIKSYDYTAISKSEQKIETPEYTVTDGSVKVKVMAFDSLDTIKPLASSREFN